MIRVERKCEPATFDLSVRKPGNDFVKKNPKKQPPKYWRECREDLYNAYEGYCAYTTFKINGRGNAVVDHFLPQKTHPNLLYEWSNYRLSSFHVNSVKKDIEPIIDPFELPEDAFRLAEDMNIEVNTSAFSDAKELALARDTLKRLKLNSPELIADRREMLDEALREVKEHPNATRLVSEMLYRQSRFLHREMVRKGYISPI